MSSIAPSSRLPKIGETLAGKYLIEGEVGRGGMAVVFMAKHIRLRQKVAIKMLLPIVLDNKDTAARFEREARAVVQLHGTNVARVLDVDTTPDGMPYIVMEFLEGHDLAAEMDERGPLPIAESVGYVLQACTAMHEAHKANIVHRDLKPANLFLCGSGPSRTVKVLDFGISKLLEETTYVTATEVVLGTPVYMSPEQIQSAKSVDPRTDIWSLGVILYEMLACELPFASKTPAAACSSIINDAPKPLKSRRPEVPTELVDVIMKALSKDLGERWPDIATFARALAPFSDAGEWETPPLSVRAPPITSVRPKGDGERASGKAKTPTTPSKQPPARQAITLDEEPAKKVEKKKAGSSMPPTPLIVLVIVLACVVLFFALRR